MRLLFRSPDHSVLGFGDRSVAMEIEMGDTFPPIVYIDYKTSKPGAKLELADVRESGRLRWSIQADSRATPDHNQVRKLISGNYRALKAAWKGFDIYRRDGRLRGEMTKDAEDAYRSFNDALQEAK